MKEARTIRQRIYNAARIVSERIPEPRVLLKTRYALFRKLGNVVLGKTTLVNDAWPYCTRVEHEQLDIEHLKLPIKGLSSSLEGFKIVQLSDFHVYPYTDLRLVREAVNLANSLEPDLIALTGDFVEGRAEMIFELAPILAQLKAPHGVFSVLGNHDVWTNGSIIQQGLEKAGLPVLVNSGLTLHVGAEKLFLAGLDDAWTGQPNITTALAELPEDTPVILLAHEPDLADELATDNCIILQLSGHSHGGQLHLPLLGTPFAPPLGRKYVWGLHRIREMWLYTNRGVGMVIVPLRVNCRPEITEITFVHN